LKFLAVEHFDGFTSFIFAAHFDERESAGFAGELVHHDVRRANNTRLGEEILKVGVNGLIGEVPYEEA